MKLVSDYMNKDTMRHALNKLTGITFGFDFENWVTGGYYEGDYIPYSWMEDGKIISNVSVNRMSFLQNGTQRNYIQLGTVMTDGAYRKQGLAKQLITHVIKEYENQCDGIYLFGNLTAVDFYRKCGFTEGMEYCYYVKPEFCNPPILGEVFQPAKAADGRMKQKYMDMVRCSAVSSSMEQINKFGLQMFYTADMDNVYYAGDIDCFIVAEMEEDTLLLQSIICADRVALSDVLQRVKGEYRECRLGFTPEREAAAMCDVKSYNGGDDYRLFYMGKALESIKKEKIYFPELSHA